METFNTWLGQATEHQARAGRPLVSLCYAQSLDGSIGKGGDGTLALSGSESLALTHRLRAAHDAILVGIGTILADAPSLTVRYTTGKNPQPVILDSSLRFPPNAKILQANPVRPWIATTLPSSAESCQKMEQMGLKIMHLPSQQSRISLPDLLDELAKRGVKSLMVEGGAQVIAAFLRQGLADLLCITIAPRFVGGLNPFVPNGKGDAFPDLEEVYYERQGNDLIVFARLVKETS